MPTRYKIEGIAPPELSQYPPAVQKQYWQWVVDFGLTRKDKELSEGLDKDGRPLRPISPKTKKYRRSAMTPSGKGDPDAPPLTPGLQKSRTRSLLAGTATTQYAEFWWRYDSFTGDSWGKVLAAQAQKGRDVFGLSAAGTAWVKARALQKWETWKSRSVSEPGSKGGSKGGTGSASVSKPSPEPPTPPGRAPTPAATYGIGDTPGKGHGGRTQAEWDAYFRATASAAPPGRPRNPAAKSPIVGPKYNRLIKYTWGQGPGPSPLPGSAAPSKTGPGPRNPGPRTLKDIVAPNAPAPSTARAALPTEPRPAPAPQPKGTPVSVALNVTMTGQGATQVQRTITMIDNLHGDGVLKRIPVKQSTRSDLHGGFAMAPWGPRHIEIQPDGPHVELTTAHEIGHYLETFGLPGGRLLGRKWATDKIFADWKKAVQESAAWKALDAQVGQKTIQVGRQTLQMPKASLEYYLTWEELWARSYSQWVAIRSGDPAMLKQLADERDIHLHPILKHVQWEDADFEPIAKAIDDTFARAGWTQ